MNGLATLIGAEQALLAALILPVLGAACVALLGRAPQVRDAVLVAFALVTFLTTIQLVAPVAAGERPGVELFEFISGISIAFEVEPLGLVFALVASGLWGVTAVYAFGYMRAHHESNQTRFFGFFALAIAAALGIAFARNLVTFFLFYELLTLSTYPLVTHHQDDEARAGGRVYLGILFGTSVALLLLAVIWTFQVAGTTEFQGGGILPTELTSGVVLALLALYVFGIGKAAVMPFHRWLPAAMVAPAPVSALLHAVAVVKAGVFGVLKVIVYVFGLDTLTMLRGDAGLGGRVVLYMACFTVVAASVVALFQDNLKRRLAYSTVSQLSYIVVGALLAHPLAWLGAALHIVTHAVGKITLFFCAGAIQVGAHKKKVSELGGLGRQMPWTMGAFLVASLSIIGLPPLAGVWGKWYLVRGALAVDEPIVVVVLFASSLLNIAYLLPIGVQAFFGEPPAPSDGSDVAKAPQLCVVPLVLTAFLTLVVFVAAPQIGSFVEGAW